MRLILAMIQVICLMAAQSPDYSNQSRLIRRLFLGRVVVVMVVKGGGESWVEDRKQVKASRTPEKRRGMWSTAFDVYYVLKVH